ncbi:MAG: hypothetical protein N3A65_05935 [candidate division WOR-3 bacterium]|nr:hypothetical protein [candidate division WOR-3 bacterium]
MNIEVLIFLDALFKKNVVLYHLLGISPFLLYNIKLKESLHTGLIIAAIMVVSNVLTFAAERLFFIPLGFGHLRILFVILSVYFIIYYSKFFLKKFSSELSSLFDNYPEFFYTNYALYGSVFLNRGEGLNFISTIISALGMGTGYLIVLFIFITCKERVDMNKKLSLFSRLSRELVLLGLMSIVFISIILRR